MPALNEAGKIGRVLDKMPRDGRFEAIVVDDGSSDGTGDEARAHGAAVVVRHDQRQGVGAAIRDGWKEGAARGRPYLALLSGDDQHVPSELGPALDALLAQNADYLQGSRWMAGGRLIGGNAGRARGTKIYSLAFSLLVGRRVTDATNGFRIFRRELLDDAKVNLDQRWLDELRPGAICVVSGDHAGLPGDRTPLHRRVPRRRVLLEDARPQGLVAAVPPGTLAQNGDETMTNGPIERSFGARRILVTGGAGFVGAAVTRRLVDAGARVTVLDDLFTGKADAIPTGASFIQGSVTDVPLINELVGDHSLILHLAARNIIASTANPLDDYATNIGGTLNVLMAARASKVDRVVYSSSASVYGNPRSIPINEDDPLWTLSPYAVSKLGGENYCTAFAESYGLRVTTVRYSNVYGPGQRPDNPYCGVVSKFLVEAHAGRPITIHGDGEQTRDYTYIDDAVEATLLAAVHPRAEGEVFNVGTGIETSVNRLAASIGEALEVEIDLRHVDRRDIDNIRRRVVNIEKIRRMLRWTPQWTLDRGLVETANWYKASSFARSAAPRRSARRGWSPSSVRPARRRRP